jgi:hypothetical protein
VGRGVLGGAEGGIKGGGGAGNVGSQPSIPSLETGGRSRSEDLWHVISARHFARVTPRAAHIYMHRETILTLSARGQSLHCY